MLHRNTEFTDYGYRLRVYCDETEREGCWYGTRAACENLPSNKVKLYPMRVAGADPFDLACERRFD